jgi:O-methyltransferase
MMRLFVSIFLQISTSLHAKSCAPDLLEDFRIEISLSNLKGLFSGTLPTASVKQLALLRLDGDLYESTMDALVNLYPKLSVGGYIIIDDMGSNYTCERAVNDYRAEKNITGPMIWIDLDGVYWQKQRGG